MHGGKSWRSQGILWVAEQELRVQGEKGRQALRAKIGDERAVQRTNSETRAGDRIKAVCSTNICANTDQKKMLPPPLLPRHAKKVLASGRTVFQYYPSLFSYHFGFR